MLTRASEQNLALADHLRRVAAIPHLFPCLTVEAFPEQIAHALQLLPDYSDLLFTSSNAIHVIHRYLQQHDLNPKALFADKRIAVVGKKTAATLTSIGLKADIIPTLASQDGLINAYQQQGMPTTGLLFFRAEEGRETITDMLHQQQVNTATIPVYRTCCPQQNASETIALLEQRKIDAVLLGSAKAARHYIHRIGSVDTANRTVIAVISPKLALASRNMGLQVQVVAKHASFEAMLDAVAAYFSAHPAIENK